MLEFFAEHELTFEQVQGLTRGLYTVAQIDGVHDREMTLIRGFYESCTRKGDPGLEEILKGGFDPAKVAPAFPGTLAKLYVKSLLLLAFADGQFARAEDAEIRKIAQAFGLGASDVDKLVEATKEFLLASLAHVQNVEALKQVAKRLELK